MKRLLKLFMPLLLLAAAPAVGVTIGKGGIAIPTEWQKARTLQGVFGEGCGGLDVEGTAQLKCGKANKKGIAKVTLTITPFSGKKRTYSSVAVDVSQGGDVEVRWAKQAYAVTIRENGEFFGEPIYSGVRPACSPNAVWSADVGGAMSGEYFIEFPEWDDWYDDWQYDGSFQKFMKVAAAQLWHQYGEGGYCPNGNSILDIGGYFTAVGKKWNFSSQFGDDKPPKITYNSKTGLFTGNVYLTIGPYCMDVDGGRMPKNKKLTLKIEGIYVNGAISGAVTYKTFSTPVRGGSASWR